MKTKIKKACYRLDFQIFISVFVIVATVFSFMSLFVTVINSLKSNSEIIANVFSLPKAKTIGGNVSYNFIKAWGGVKTSFLSSIVLALIGAFVNCLLGSILAYIFAYKDFTVKISSLWCLWR